MEGSNRIIFNTGVTYAKAILTSVISLYGTRLILQALGAQDFGLYNVLGGIVAMLAFINAAMTTSTQRFISYNLGTKDFQVIKKVFANSVILHLIIGLSVVALIEGIGLYFIQYQLKIDSHRIEAARIILHFSAVSTFISIISVPYDAVINAYENMSFLAVVSIFESILKLLVAISILYLSGDKLIYYGLLMMLVSIIIRVVKRSYSKRKYEICRISITQYYDKSGVKELTSFAGWNLFGTLCALGRNQGVGIILNLFYTTVVNAAYGVANQINAQLMFFSQTMMSAIRPQIMKSEGANNRVRMIRLSLSANKLAFFLFTFFALPFYFEMPLVLKLWLKDVPQYTVDFCRAILLLTMANQINMGLMTAVQAIGKIKLYQVVAGGIQLLTLPIGYFFLKFGYQPHSVILVSFVLECISTVFRIFYFKHLTGYKVRNYLKAVFLRSFLTAFPALISLVFLSKYFNSSIIDLIIIMMISSSIYLVSILIFGLDNEERNIVFNALKKIKGKISSKR